jgi:hypothetical protein
LQFLCQNQFESEFVVTADIAFADLGFAGDFVGLFHAQDRLQGMTFSKARFGLCDDEGLEGSKPIILAEFWPDVFQSDHRISYMKTSLAHLPV